MKTSLKEAIQSRIKQSQQLVEVPDVEGYGTVYVRRLSSMESDKYGLSVLSADGKPDTAKMAGKRASLVAMALRDKDGTQPLSLMDAESMTTADLQPLYDACAKVNGIGQRAEEEAGNDSTIQGGDS